MFFPRIIIQIIHFFLAGTHVFCHVLSSQHGVKKVHYPPYTNTLQPLKVSLFLSTFYTLTRLYLGGGWVGEDVGGGGERAEAVNSKGAGEESGRGKVDNVEVAAHAKGERVDT